MEPPSSPATAARPANGECARCTIGLPGAPAGLYLMASIGSDTHGNRECSPENGQKDPPAASASQGKAGAETEFPERILVCGGGRANWCGAFQSTEARFGSGVTGDRAGITYGVPTRRSPPPSLTSGFLSRFRVFLGLMHQMVDHVSAAKQHRDTNQNRNKERHDRLLSVVRAG